MEEIIRIEDKAHCLLNKQCDRLKKLWGEGTYLTILHSIVVYVLALKANISCSMQDFFHEVLHGNFVGIDEESLKVLINMVPDTIGYAEIQNYIVSFQNSFVDKEILIEIERYMELVNCKRLETSFYNANLADYSFNSNIEYSLMSYGDHRLFEYYLFSIYSCCIGQKVIASNTYSDDDTLFVVDLSAYMKNENTFSNLKQELFDKINKDKIIFVIPNKMLEYSYMSSDKVNSYSNEVRQYLFLLLGFSWKITEFAKCSIAYKLDVKQSVHVTFSFVKNDMSVSYFYNIKDYSSIKDKFQSGMNDNDVLFHNVTSLTLRPSFFTLHIMVNRLLKAFIKEKYTHGLQGVPLYQDSYKVNWKECLSFNDVFKRICIYSEGEISSSNVYCDLYFNNIEEICGDAYELEPAYRLNNLKRTNLKSIIQKASELIRNEASRHSIYLQPSDMLFLMKHIEIPRTLLSSKSEKLVNMVNKMYAAGLKSSKLQNLETVIPEISEVEGKPYYEKLSKLLCLFETFKILHKDKYNIYTWHTKIDCTNNIDEFQLNMMRNDAKTKHLFFFLCSACVDDLDKLIFFNTDEGLSYKNYTDMRKELIVFFPYLKSNQIKNSEDQFRKNMKEFSVGQYDIAKFEKTEDFDIETKKKRKKMYLDLIEDYIKTDLLSMKEESENSASRFLKELKGFINLLNGSSDISSDRK
jgi:hypothetical protein